MFALVSWYCYFFMFSWGDVVFGNWMVSSVVEYLDLCFYCHVNYASKFSDSNYKLHVYINFIKLDEGGSFLWCRKPTKI